MLKVKVLHTDGKHYLRVLAQGHSDRWFAIIKGEFVTVRKIDDQWVSVETFPVFHLEDGNVHWVEVADGKSGTIAGNCWHVAELIVDGHKSWFTLGEVTHLESVVANLASRKFTVAEQLALIDACFAEGRELLIQVICPFPANKSLVKSARGYLKDYPLSIYRYR